MISICFALIWISRLRRTDAKKSSQTHKQSSIGLAKWKRRHNLGYSAVVTLIKHIVNSQLHEGCTNISRKWCEFQLNRNKSRKNTIGCACVFLFLLSSEWNVPFYPAHRLNAIEFRLIEIMPCQMSWIQTMWKTRVNHELLDMEWKWKAVEESYGKMQLDCGIMITWIWYKQFFKQIRLVIRLSLLWKH